MFILYPLPAGSRLCCPLHLGWKLGTVSVVLHVGKKVGTAEYKKLYCLCLMGWKSQKGKKNDGRQNAVGIIFISKIAKLNL